MSRKKSVPEEAFRRVRIRVLVSFDGFRAGEEYDIHLDPTVAGWINLGVVGIVKELEVSGGQVEAGSGGAEPDVLGGIEG